MSEKRKPFHAARDNVRGWWYVYLATDIGQDVWLAGVNDPLEAGKIADLLNKAYTWARYEVAEEVRHA